MRVVSALLLFKLWRGQAEVLCRVIKVTAERSQGPRGRETGEDAMEVALALRESIYRVGGKAGTGA